MLITPNTYLCNDINLVFCRWQLIKKIMNFSPPMYVRKRPPVEMQPLGMQGFPPFLIVLNVQPGPDNRLIRRPALTCLWYIVVDDLSYQWAWALDKSHEDRPLSMHRIVLTSIADCLGKACFVSNTVWISTFRYFFMGPSAHWDSCTLYNFFKVFRVVSKSCISNEHECCLSLSVML